MSYEIAVACDISLGPIIKECPDVSSIDIDPKAVQTVLNDFAQKNDDSTKRELLVVAKHFDSLQSKLKRGTHTSGNFIPANKSKSGLSEVNVAVAGDPWNFSFPNPWDFVDTLAASIENGDDMKQSIKELTAIAVVDPISDDKAIQETTIHELSHSADHLDPAARKESFRYRYKNLILKLGTYGLTNYVVLSGINSLNYIQESTINPIVQGSSQATLGVLCGFLAVRLVHKSAHEEYLAAPDEIRARLHEEMALKYPQIITIT